MAHHPPTFSESRSNAYRLLGDAADEIRMSDWTPPPSAAQRAAIRKALKHIGEAKAALDRASR
jgi:hypothetical protein